MPSTSPHDYGHMVLTAWAHVRALSLEAAGSASRPMGEMVGGASGSTAPGRLTSLERQVDLHDAALRVEIAVRSLPAVERRLVFARYVTGGSVSAAARAVVCHDREARKVLRRAVEMVGKDIALRENQDKKQRIAAQKLRKPQVGLDGIAKNAQDCGNSTTAPTGRPGV